MTKRLLFRVKIKQLCALMLLSLLSTNAHELEETGKCDAHSQNLKYVWGDALTDIAGCIGPNNKPYPSALISRMVRKAWSSSSRSGRSMNALDPLMTKRLLMRNHENNRELNRGPEVTLSRTRRDFNPRDVCPSSSPSRLCRTRYNTTAPMYGVSLTSGQPVTIVQKFPDLLQQVIYEVCETNECDLVRGECTQTYVPYLFLVIPLGPVTLTGQDYVLVESGCVCKPKPHYSNVISESMSALPTL